MAKVEILNIDTSQATSSIKALRQQLKELKDQMAGLEEGSDEFLKVAAAAGEVKHQIDEIQQSVNGASADFGDMLSSATGALNGIVGGFTAAQGVMNLFGIESESAVEAMKDLQALMAIGQGIAQIDNGIKAFKKFANAIKTTETYQKLFNKAQLQGVAITKQDTVATKLATAAKIAGTVATKAATIATRAFSVALKAIGIGLIIEAVNLLIEGIKKLVKWFNSLKVETVSFNDVLKNSIAYLEIYRNQAQRTQKTASFKKSIEDDYIAFYKLADQVAKTRVSFDELNKSQRTTEEIARNSNLIKYGNELEQYITSIGKITDEVSLLQAQGGLDQNLFNVSVATTANMRDIANIFGMFYDDSKTIYDVFETFSNFADKPLNTVNDIRGYMNQIEKSIQNIQIKLDYGSLSDEERENLLTQMEKYRNYLKIYEDLADNLEDATKSISKAINSNYDSIVKLLQLEMERRKNAADIYKIQIDGQAAIDEEYKNSSMYLQDQIKYYNRILKLQQQGSKEWVQTYQTIRKLTNEALPKLTTQLTSDVQPVVANIDDKLNKLGEGLALHTANWREQVLLTGDDIYKQFNIIIDTMQRLSESSLGLSSNWTTAFSDVQTAMKSFVNNIANSADAGAAQWAQSFALGAQAVGTILNTLSEEQDGNTKEGFETQKKYQIGATVLNTAAGIVNAWVSAMAPTNSYLTLPGQIALASTTTAALTALAGVQIAKIQKAQFGGGSADVSSGSITSTLVAPTQYTQAVQNANIESKLGDNRVYVVESDINRTGRRVSVQETENTY